MTDNKKWIDISHEIANELERNASEKLNMEVEIAKAKHAGYYRACEDYASMLRGKIRQGQFEDLAE